MLSRLNLIQKLTLSTMAFIACIFALIFFYTQNIGANIEFSQKELQGNAYQRALMPLLYNTTELRAAHIRGGDTSAVASQIDKDFIALKTAQESVGESLQFTEEGLSSRDRSHLKLETVMAKWDDLKRISAAPYTAKAGEAYQSLVSDIRGMIAHAGDTSNLILDPDLDSYYLMDVTLLALPQTIDRLGQLQAMLMDKTSLDFDERTEIAVIARMLKEADHDRVVGDFDISYKEDANFNGVSTTLKPNTESVLGNFKDSYVRLIAAMDTLSKTGHPEDIRQVVGLAIDAEGRADTLWTASVAELDQLLTVRVGSISAQQMQVLIECGVGLLLAVLFFVIVVRDVTRPLKDINSSMKELISGNIRYEIPHGARKDEIGRMANALTVFQKGLIEKDELKASQEMEKMQAEMRKKDELEKLASNFELNVKHVVDVVASAATEMDATSQSVGKTVNQSMHKLGTLATSVEGVSSTVGTVSSSTVQLSSAINEISQQVSKATSITHNAVEQGTVANNTVTTLVDAARSIGEVVEVINAITEQINLLALNATIEAARAGEAGKGFAVVASEVKNLANQTQKATEEITRKVQGIQQTSSETATVINAITGTINEINSISTAIAAAVEEQGMATKNIAENIEHASRETKSIADNAGQVSQSANQTSASADEMQIASTELSKQAEHLRQEVDKFLQNVRAG